MFLLKSTLIAITVSLLFSGCWGWGNVKPKRAQADLIHIVTDQA